MRAADCKPPAIAISPLTITDRSCEEFTGLEPRPWKLALVELKVPHCKAGRRTICTAAAWIAAVERASGAPSSAASFSDADVIELASRSRKAGAK